MARNLKPGERVTVSEVVHFSQSSPAYKQGLKNVNPGQVGEVIGQGEGRSTLVKFDNIQVSISNQRLERSQAAEPAKEPQKKASPAAENKQQKRGRKATQTKPTETESKNKRSIAPKARETAEVVQDIPAVDNSAQLLTLIANRLLLKGTAKLGPDTTVEVNIADLPQDLQQQVQALIDAKLSLDLSQFKKR